MQIGSQLAAACALWACAAGICLAADSRPEFSFGEGEYTINPSENSVILFSESYLAALGTTATGPGLDRPEAVALLLSVADATLAAARSVGDAATSPDAIVSLMNGFHLAAIWTGASPVAAIVVAPLDASSSPLSIEDLSDGRLGQDKPTLFAPLPDGGQNGPALVVAVGSTQQQGPTPQHPLVVWDLSTSPPLAASIATGASGALDALEWVSDDVVAAVYDQGDVVFVRVSGGTPAIVGTYSFALGNGGSVVFARPPLGGFLAAAATTAGTVSLFDGQSNVPAATLVHPNVTLVAGLHITAAGSVLARVGRTSEVAASGSACQQQQPQQQQPQQPPPQPVDPNVNCTITEVRDGVQVWKRTAAGLASWALTVDLEKTEFTSVSPLSADVAIVETGGESRLFDASTGELQGTGFPPDIVPEDAVLPGPSPPNPSQSRSSTFYVCLGSEERSVVVNKEFLKLVSHCKQTGRGPLGDGSCAACAAGHANGAPFGFCRACATGDFANGTGNAACTACPPGSVAPVPATAICSPCLPGTFGFGRGLTQCTDCPAGTIAPDAGLAECQPCPVGSFQASPGQTRCSACADAGEGDAVATLLPGEQEMVGASHVCPLGAVAPLPTALFTAQGVGYEFEYPLSSFVANRITEYNEAVRILYAAVAVFFAVLAVTVALLLLCPPCSCLRPCLVRRLKKMDTFADNYILQEEEFVSRSERQLAMGGFLRIMHLLGLGVITCSLALGFYFTNANQESIFHGSRFEESVTELDLTTQVSLFGDAANLNLTCEAHSFTGASIASAIGESSHPARRVATLDRVATPTSFTVVCGWAALRRSAPAHGIAFSVRVFSDVGEGSFTGTVSSVLNGTIGPGASVSAPLSSLVLLLNDTLDDSVQYGAELNLAEAPEAGLNTVTSTRSLGEGSSGRLTFSVSRASGLKELRVTQKQTWVAVLSQVLAISGGLAAAATFLAQLFYGWYADARRGQWSRGAKLYNLGHKVVVGVPVRLAKGMHATVANAVNDVASVIRTSSASAVHPVSAASYAPAPASLSSSDGEAAPTAKVGINAKELEGLLQRIELLERRLNARSAVGENADMQMEDM